MSKQPTDPLLDINTIELRLTTEEFVQFLQHNLPERLSQRNETALVDLLIEHHDTISVMERWPQAATKPSRLRSSLLANGVVHNVASENASRSNAKTKSTGMTRPIAGTSSISPVPERSLSITPGSGISKRGRVDKSHNNKHGPQYMTPFPEHTTRSNSGPPQSLTKSFYFPHTHESFREMYPNDPKSKLAVEKVDDDTEAQENDVTDSAKVGSRPREVVSAPNKRKRDDHADMQAAQTAMAEERPSKKRQHGERSTASSEADGAGRSDSSHILRRKATRAPALSKLGPRKTTENRGRMSPAESDAFRSAYDPVSKVPSHQTGTQSGKTDVIDLTGLDNAPEIDAASTAIDLTGLDDAPEADAAFTEINGLPLYVDQDALDLFFPLVDPVDPAASYDYHEPQKQYVAGNFLDPVSRSVSPDLWPQSLGPDAAFRARSPDPVWRPGSPLQWSSTASPYTGTISPEPGSGTVSPDDRWEEALSATDDEDEIYPSIEYDEKDPGSDNDGDAADSNIEYDLELAPDYNGTDMPWNFHEDRVIDQRSVSPAGSSASDAEFVATERAESDSERVLAICTEISF